MKTRLNDLGSSGIEYHMRPSDLEGQLVRGAGKYRVMSVRVYQPQLAAVFLQYMLAPFVVHSERHIFPGLSAANQNAYTAFAVEPSAHHGRDYHVLRVLQRIRARKLHPATSLN